jgi:hypothetical protein
LEEVRDLTLVEIKYLGEMLTNASKPDVDQQHEILAIKMLVVDCSVLENIKTSYIWADILPVLSVRGFRIVATSSKSMKDTLEIVKKTGKHYG